MMGTEETTRWTMASSWHHIASASDPNIEYENGIRPHETTVNTGSINIHLTKEGIKCEQSTTIDDCCLIRVETDGHSSTMGWQPDTKSGQHMATITNNSPPRHDGHSWTTVDGTKRQDEPPEVFFGLMPMRWGCCGLPLPWTRSTREDRF